MKHPIDIGIRSHSLDLCSEVHHQLEQRTMKPIMTKLFPDFSVSQTRDLHQQSTTATHQWYIMAVLVCACMQTCLYLSHILRSAVNQLLTNNISKKSIVTNQGTHSTINCLHENKFKLINNLADPMSSQTSSAITLDIDHENYICRH